jgi:hypothetical protein
VRAKEDLRTKGKKQADSFKPQSSKYTVSLFCLSYCSLVHGARESVTSSHLSLLDGASELLYREK